MNTRQADPGFGNTGFTPPIGAPLNQNIGANTVLEMINKRRVTSDGVHAIFAPFNVRLSIECIERKKALI